MIIAFAGDFIHTGGSVEQKPMRLNAACTAWNIANLLSCLPCRNRTGPTTREAGSVLDRTLLAHDGDTVAVRLVNNHE